VTAITSEQEIESVQQALEEAPSEAAVHLKQALMHMSHREHPDFRSSIKQSISAVEATVRRVTRDPKATLGKALKKLGLHPALEQGFGKLYGYASDRDGIRHALNDMEHGLTADDARYFLVSCSAFINYLLAKFSVTQDSG
jgi:uncharacterized protein with PIN domain